MLVRIRVRDVIQKISVETPEYVEVEGEEVRLVKYHCPKCKTNFELKEEHDIGAFIHLRCGVPVIKYLDEYSALKERVMKMSKEMELLKELEAEARRSSLMEWYVGEQIKAIDKHRESFSEN